MKLTDLFEIKSFSSINWTECNGDWVKAKQKGKEIFDMLEKAGKLKDGDEVLELRNQVEKKRKSGSYIAAVLADKLKDHHEAIANPRVHD